MLILILILILILTRQREFPYLDGLHDSMEAAAAARRHAPLINFTKGNTRARAHTHTHTHTLAHA